MNQYIQSWQARANFELRVTFCYGTVRDTFTLLKLGNSLPQIPRTKD